MLQNKLKGCGRDLASLQEILEYIATLQAVSPEDISQDAIQNFKKVEQSLSSLSAFELQVLMDTVDQILQQIENAHRSGKSNYLFFGFLKLKKKLLGLPFVSTRQEPIRILDSVELLDRIVTDRFRLNRTNFPDSPACFIEIGRQSDYFHQGLPQNSPIEGMDPVIFTLNPGIFTQIETHQTLNLVTGHCIQGFEPHEDKTIALATAIKEGLSLDNISTYVHVKTLARQLDSRYKIGNMFVFLDSIYYYQRVAEHIGPGVSDSEVRLSVDRLVQNHTKTISEILPNSRIIANGILANRDLLDTVVFSGLLEFIRNEVRYFMGHDLRIESERAYAVALTAASYLYSPLILEKPTLAVESALNVENPVKIVFKYLDKIGKTHLFGFLGLLPVPDLKMSHGSMHYGSATHGKVFLGDSEDTVWEKVSNMSRNWEQPHRCFYVHYFLARQNRLPCNFCHLAMCPNHQALIVDDIHRLTKSLK